MEEKNAWKWPENSYNPVSMYALFNSFSPQIFDRLFDKINKYFEHVFKSYLNKIRILFIIITHSTTLDTESLKNDCSVKHTAKKHLLSEQNKLKWIKSTFQLIWNAWKGQACQKFTMLFFVSKSTSASMRENLIL